jgi:hypothetical protein
MKKLIVFVILCIAVMGYAQNLQRSGSIKFDLTSVSLEKNGEEKTDRTFKPLDVVWINLKVHGLQKDADTNVIFQADLLMTGANGRVVLDKKNILNQNLNAGDIEPVVTATFNISLYEDIKPGPYRVKITFRDMVAKKYNVFETGFKVVK